MRFIKRSLQSILISGLLLLQIGCSVEYQVNLFNYSGSSISLVASGATEALRNGGSVLLYDKKAKENILLPITLKVNSDGKEYCYFLDRIKVGGYARYSDSNILLVSLKLGEDNKVYVYNVSGGEFNPNNDVGIQPKGYPAQPGSC